MIPVLTVQTHLERISLLGVMTAEASRCESLRRNVACVPVSLLPVGPKPLRACALG